MFTIEGFAESDIEAVIAVDFVFVSFFWVGNLSNLVIVIDVETGMIC